jgi:hypothetical protein
MRGRTSGSPPGRGRDGSCPKAADRVTGNRGLPGPKAFGRNAPVRRATRFYFGFFGAAFVFFGLGAVLSTSESCVGWEACLRFLVLSAGAGCAAGTWGTAVMIASVHKVTWPLVLSTVIVVAGAIAFALIGHRASP